MSDFSPVSDLAARFAAARRVHAPVIAEQVTEVFGPDDAMPDDDAGVMPPDEADPASDAGSVMPPEDPPETALEARVLIPDEILDPEQLVPVSAIVRRVEGITVLDVATSVALASRALSVTRVLDDDGQTALDALRDDLKAHQAAIEARLDPFIAVANRLHKGLTGLRAAALDRVPDAVKHAGNLLGGYLRQQQEAEAARQRVEREKALAAERARLQAEAAVAEGERQRLATAADEARKTDTAAAAILQQAADREALTAEQARQEAATCTAPPVMAQAVVAPAGSSTRDNWQCLPAHGETWDDFPLGDKRALIIFIAERLTLDDGSFIHLVDVSKQAAKDMAKAQRDTMKIPGLRAVNPAVYAKRAKG